MLVTKWNPQGLHFSVCVYPIKAARSQYLLSSSSKWAIMENQYPSDEHFGGTYYVKCIIFTSTVCRKIQSTPFITSQSLQSDTKGNTIIPRTLIQNRAWQQSRFPGHVCTGTAGLALKIVYIFKLVNKCCPPTSAHPQSSPPAPLPGPSFSQLFLWQLKC